MLLAVQVQTLRRCSVAVLIAVTALAVTTTGCAPTSKIGKGRYERPGWSSGNGGNPSSGSGSSTRPSSSAQTRYHVIKKGENLYRISLRYGVTVTDLKQSNGIIDETKLVVGQRLIIPGRGGVAVARPSATTGSSTTSRPSTSTGPTTAPASASAAGFIWPLKKYTLTSKFGVRGTEKHDGIDLGAPQGTDILAVAGGKVIFSGRGPSGYGNIIIVKHDKGLITVYAHNDKNLTRQGESVKQGEKIATVGNSGRATGYHLHFEVRANRQTVDPLRYLPRH